MSNTQHLQDFTTQVRRDILRMVHAVNSGHRWIFGLRGIFTVLYQHQMQRKAGFDMNGIGEDLFSFLTAIFRRFLQRFSPKRLFSCSRIGNFSETKLTFARPSYYSRRLTGCPYGFGFIGTRFIGGYWCSSSQKLNGDQHLVYSLHGDGELQEGQNWEAIMYASAKKWII